MNKRPLWIRSVSADGAESLTPGWTIKSLVRNYPGYMGVLSAYYSTLSAGQTPHAPHAHIEEEIFVLLSGRLDVVTSERNYRIGPGSFLHHPPGDFHTIRSVGPESAGFLVFKWTWQNAASTRSEAVRIVFDADGMEPRTGQAGMHRRRVCESQPLANGGRLVIDTVRLAPRAGYPNHCHEHDLMLILLRGNMHALGRNTCAPAIIYYPAGTIHGLAPLSPDPIDMIAFEFHRPSAS